MVTRRWFLRGLTMGALATPAAAEAQSGARKPRVGLLWFGPSPTGTMAPRQPSFAPTLAALREFGWLESKNIVLEHRFADTADGFSRAAVDLVRLGCDVIMAGGGPASLRAARQATQTIPIVMVTTSADPVADGIVKSLARPDGNITGVAFTTEAFAGKWPELLREAIPGLSRVGYVPIGAGRSTVRDRIEEAARSLRLELRVIAAPTPDEIERAVGKAASERVQALIIGSHPMFVIHRQRLVETVMKYRLPAVSGWREFADAGLLLTYGPSISAQYRLAVTYVDKILKGTKLAELPIERPAKFELVVNLRTAKVLGLTIPPPLLLRAEQVVE